MWTDKQIKGKILHKLTRAGKFEHSHTAIEHTFKGFPPELKGKVKVLSTDLVKEGISGFCFPPDDREYLKSLVLKFLGDKGLAQKMGEESRKTAVSGYSMSEVAQELIEIYKNPQLPSY